MYFIAQIAYHDQACVYPNSEFYILFSHIRYGIIRII